LDSADAVPAGPPSQVADPLIAKMEAGLAACLNLSEVLAAAAIVALVVIVEPDVRTHYW
jgi:hypothetical protein